MNHDGPWSWRSSKQGKRASTDEERAYIERVSRGKQNRSSKQAAKRRRATASEVRKRNERPIF